MLVKRVNKTEKEIVITYKLIGITLYKKVMPITKENERYQLIDLL